MLKKHSGRKDDPLVIDDDDDEFVVHFPMDSSSTGSKLDHALPSRSESSSPPNMISKRRSRGQTPSRRRLSSKFEPLAEAQRRASLKTTLTDASGGDGTTAISEAGVAEMSQPSLTTELDDTGVVESHLDPVDNDVNSMAVDIGGGRLSSPATQEAVSVVQPASPLKFDGSRLPYTDKKSTPLVPSDIKTKDATHLKTDLQDSDESLDVERDDMAVDNMLQAIPAQGMTPLEHLKSGVGTHVYISSYSAFVG